MSFDFLRLYLAVALAGFCLWTDVRTRTIYNVVTYPAAIMGALLSLITAQYLNILGARVVFFLYLLFVLTGKMGAGDLKLAVALTLLLGIYPVLLGSILAGILAAAWVFAATWQKTGKIQEAMMVVTGKSPGGEVPYGAFLGPAAVAAALAQFFM